MRCKFSKVNKITGDSAGKHNQPYTILAEIYDLIMNHVDYCSWAIYISSIFKRFNVKVTNILDIGCGTGSLSVELYKIGYNVTSMDISIPMLAQAAQKFRKHGIPLRLFSSSMTLIPLSYQFDAVICLYDSVNYMTTPEYFIKAVTEALSVTRSGGIFVFDVCTVKNSELYFLEYSSEGIINNIQYKRISRFNPVERMQENHFFIQKNGKRFVESHYQKVYKLQEVSRMIAHTAFVECARYDDLSFAPGTENSDRVHFILQK